MKLRLSTLLPIPLLLFVGIVYLKTLPPSILWVDSGTMVAAAATLGIPNPPGFPTYILASHLFGLLPLGGVLFEMQLFSIIFALLSLFLVYRCILLLLGEQLYFQQAAKEFEDRPQILKVLAACFGTLALAFSYQFWSQAHNTDAFLFTDFFYVLLLFLTLKIAVHLKKRYFEVRNVDVQGYKKSLFGLLLLIALVYGLAAGANPTISQFVPAVLFILYLNRRYLSGAKLAVLLLIFVSATLALYSYLPIRASQHPYVNWGNPDTLGAALQHMVGSGLNIYAPEASLVNGFTGSPEVFFNSFFHFAWSALVQFTPLLLPFLVFGVWSAWRANKLLLVFLSLPVGVNILYGSLYYSGNQESWFIASHIIFALALGIGFYYLGPLIARSRQALIGLFLLSFLPLLFWYRLLDRNWHQVTTDYGNNLYQPLAQNALLLGIGDLFGSQSYYLHEVDKIRPDVTPLIWNQFYFSSWMRENVKATSDVVISDEVEQIFVSEDPAKYNRAANQFFADNIERHPIYVLPFLFESSLFPGDPQGLLQLDERFRYIPHGLAFRVVKKDDLQSVYFDSFEFKFLTPGFPQNQPTFLERTYNRLQSDVIYQYGRALQAAGDWWLTEKNNGPNALFWYKKAREFSPYSPELLLRFGYVYSLTDQYDGARQYFEKAVSINSAQPTYHYYLANAYLNLGRMADARRELEVLEQLDPNGAMAKDVRQMLEKVGDKNEQ